MAHGRKKVFVYGTLRKGGLFHDRYMKDAHFLGDAQAQGILFSCGRYPGAQFFPTDTYVKGEIYLVDAATMEEMDTLEGFDERRPEMSMYVRRRIIPELPTSHGGRPTFLKECWAYEYRPEPPARFPVIKSGDWIEYYRERG